MEWSVRLIAWMSRTVRGFALCDCEGEIVTVGIELEFEEGNLLVMRCDYGVCDRTCAIMGKCGRSLNEIKLFRSGNDALHDSVM